jgi:hypothetical protein
MPAGDGLVQPSPEGPAQREGEAGAGDQPGGVLPGEDGEPGGLGDGQLDGCDAGRAGLAAAAGDGRVAEGYLQVSVADVVAGRRVRVVVVAEAGGGEIDAAVECAPDGGGPELGEGGQGGVPEGPGPAAGLALIPSEHVLAGFEGLFTGVPLQKCRYQV